MEFVAATKTNVLSVIEHWWSVRAAVKYASDNPNDGLSPWIMVNYVPYSPDEVLRAHREIMKQDAYDAHRPKGREAPR